MGLQKEGVCLKSLVDECRPSYRFLFYDSFHVNWKIQAYMASAIEDLLNLDKEMIGYVYKHGVGKLPYIEQQTQ